MAKRLNKPRQSEPVAAPHIGASPVQSSWRDHPLAIAGGVAVATVGVVVLVVKEIVLPTLTATLNNQISALNVQVSEIPALRKSKADSDAKLAKVEHQLAEANKKVAQAQQANLFSPGNPYPVGLGKVRIGDSIESVANAFPDSSIDRKEDSHWTVKSQHGVFNDVVYYIDERSPKKPITHILFMHSNYLDSAIDSSFLQEKLTESFGPPKTYSKKDYYSWKLGSNYSLYKTHRGVGFVLMPNGQSPAYWPVN